MGILVAFYRLLNPLNYAKRRVRRAISPRIVPRPIAKALWIGSGVAHPLSRARYSIRRGLIRKVDKAITPKRRRRRKAHAQRSGDVTKLVANNSIASAVMPFNKWEDITTFVAEKAAVPVESLRKFNHLVAAGAKEQASKVFTNEEGLRIAAAYQEATRLLRGSA